MTGVKGTASEILDVVIIGAGQASNPLLWDLAKSGRRVALAERKHLGGSCVNYGCTPTKAVIASARVAHLARRAAEFGIAIPSVSVDFPAVLEGARAIAQESRDGLMHDFQGCTNPSLLFGHARFIGRDEQGFFRVGVGEDRMLTARQVVLDTGTRSQIPEIEGLDTIPYLNAENWIEQTTLPEHLILLGGGYIGLEMSQFYRRMGSKVTLLDRSPRLIAKEDPEVAAELQQILEDEGIAFHLKTEIEKVTASPKGVTVTYRSGNRTERVSGSHLFVAVGRKPNTDALGLETIGLSLPEDGFIPVDERLATTVPGVWAVGDIRGGPMFTHTSWDDYRILKSQLLEDGTRIARRNVPSVIFTDPALGRIGLTETEARKADRPIKVGRFEVCHNGHMRTFRARQGLIKVVVDAETERLLGATLFCDEAGELLHIYEMLMNADAPYSVLRDAVIAHPTRAEAVQSALEAVEGG